MQKISKEFGSVFCGKEAWTEFHKKMEALDPSKVFVITDTHTRQHCSTLFQKHYDFPVTPIFLEMPAGEINKKIDQCVTFWNELSQYGADRHSVCIHLGGGVVTDLGGFVASTFKRGITFINIPTSLLAMVDAAVGGKNGVDLGYLKNQIGVIQDPLFTLIDIDFLDTLPEEELISGYAEILKHGLIHSKEYWEKAVAIDFSNKSQLEQLVWDSIEIKHDIVRKDPREKGLRKTLNFGHTLGHAIESYCLKEKDHQTLLHGEAVAIGIILACHLSFQRHEFPEAILTDVCDTIQKHYPTPFFSKTAIHEIVELLAFDKKNDRGKVCFVLLSDFGTHVIDCEVPTEQIFLAFEFYNKLNS